MKKLVRFFGVWLGGLACLTWLLPVQCVAGEGLTTASTPAVNRPVIRDVALGKNGSMTGQLLDAQGQTRPNQIVVVQRQGGEPRKTQTDNDGRFLVSGLTGGTYYVATVDSAAFCRCWTERTA